MIICKQMRLIRPQSWALVLLSAFLQISSFPFAGPLPYWRSSVGWIALTPLLLAILSAQNKQQSGTKEGITASSATPGQAFLLGYLCGFVTFAGSCYWIYQTMFLYGGLARPVSLLILILFALYLGLYQGIFSLLLVTVDRGFANSGLALAVSPALWVAIELGRARITGFPWDLLGNSQIDNLLLTRLAPLTGVMGLSFVLVSVSALAAGALLSRKRFSLLVGCVAALSALARRSLGRPPAACHRCRESRDLRSGKSCCGRAGQRSLWSESAAGVKSFFRSEPKS